VKPVDFSLFCPDTLDEAVSQVAERADSVKVLAGGQSLIPLLNFRLARPDRLVDLSRIKKLRSIDLDGDELIVGAMASQAAAEHDERVSAAAPLLAASIPHIAHPPIRVRGTIGGSSAHADPAAEIPAVALALDATFVAISLRGIRRIPAAMFFRGFLTTDLADDEILTEIRFPRSPDASGAAFEEVGRRHGDFALVGVGAQIAINGGKITDARIACTGVGETPIRCSAAEERLVGTALDHGSVAEAAALVRDAVSPGDDLHATAAYRRHAAGVLTARAVQRACREAAASC
jgi:carbon-monoxide dehydrogenase medium subunit